MSDFRSRFFVKICGVTTLGDANAAIDAGADAIGLILATSPRQLSLNRALAIAEATNGRTVRTLVFRDNDSQFIEHALDLIGPDIVQIHGATNDELLAVLRERKIGVIKAVAIDSDEFHSLDDTVVDAVLVDGASPGSGQPHSWEGLSDRHFGVPLIAAGGLNDDNVASVIAGSSVWGVDCASGVESSPGVKDRDRLHRFVLNARSAFEERGHQ